MTRLATVSLETADTMELSSIIGSPTVDSSRSHGGAYSLASSAGQHQGRFDYAHVDGRACFIRFYFRIDQDSAQGKGIFSVWQTVNTFGNWGINLNGSNQLTATDTSGATVPGSAASPPILLGDWYRVEAKWIIQGGDLDDGTLEVGWAKGDAALNTICSTTAGNMFDNPICWTIGFTGTSDPLRTIYLDDIAFNDDQGAQDNGYVGPGKRVLLRPGSDNAVGTGWETPQTTGADTTDLFEGVNNIPLLGVAHSDVDANNNKYIFNAASDAATNYDANLETYASRGIRNAARILSVQPVVVTGSSSTTDTSGALDLVSNPAGASELAFVFDANNVVAGAHPTGWKLTFGGLYVPTGGDPVDVNVAPVLRGGKRTATTRVAMVSLMGLMVDYTEVQPPPPSAFHRPHHGLLRSVRDSWERRRRSGILVPREIGGITC